jgi:hypothetical protein
MKSLDVINSDDARKKVPDIKHYGGDQWILFSKAWSKEQGWMKSTKVLEIHDVGCLINVTTQQGDHIAEALCFVPDVSITVDMDSIKLSKISNTKKNKSVW